MDFTHSHKDINAWAKKFASGDTKAAEKVFNYFYPIIYRYMSSRLADKEQVDDICQEVFFKVARSIRLYNADNGNFSAWIWQIARNTFTDHLRAKKRKHDEPESKLGDEFKMDSLASPELENVELSDDLEKVMAIVREFPPEDQELFRLRYVSELSYEEMTDVTGRSVNALTVALYRIRERIKKAYEA